MSRHTRRFRRHGSRERTIDVLLRDRQEPLNLNTIGGQVDAIGMAALATDEMDSRLADCLSEATGAPHEQCIRMLARYPRDMQGAPHPEPPHRYIDFICLVNQGLVEALTEQFGARRRRQSTLFRLVPEGSMSRPSRAERRRRRAAHEAEASRRRAIDEIGERWWRALSGADATNCDYWDLEAGLGRVLQSHSLAERMLERYSSVHGEYAEDEFGEPPQLSGFIDRELEYNRMFVAAMTRELGQPERDGNLLVFGRPRKDAAQ